MYQKHSLTLNGVEEEVNMAKTKTETETKEVKGPKVYWTAKEKEQLNNKYSTELLVENCNQEQRTNKYLPSDAYVVTYKHEKESLNRKNL